MFRNDKDLSSPCWVSSLNQWPRHLLGLLVSRKIQVLYNILLGYSQVLRDCDVTNLGFVKGYSLSGFLNSDARTCEFLTRM